MWIGGAGADRRLPGPDRTAPVRLAREADAAWLGRYQRKGVSGVSPAGAGQRPLGVVRDRARRPDGHARGDRPVCGRRALGRFRGGGGRPAACAAGASPPTVMAALARRALDEGASAAWLQVEADNAGPGPCTRGWASPRITRTTTIAPRQRRWSSGCRRTVDRLIGESRRSHERYRSRKGHEAAMRPSSARPERSAERRRRFAEEARAAERPDLATLCLLVGAEADGALDEAGLDAAQIELDRLAGQLPFRPGGPRSWATALAELLGGRCGFRGTPADYGGWTPRCCTRCCGGGAGCRSCSRWCGWRSRGGRAPRSTGSPCPGTSSSASGIAGGAGPRRSVRRAAGC